MSSRIEKWVCGTTIEGKWVVRQVFVTETPQKFIVDQEDAEINRLVGYRTHIRKSENIFFNSGSAAVQHQIDINLKQAELLAAQLKANQADFWVLKEILYPR